MRPICRGIAPRTYSDYRDALGDLENRLGRYCSYCERHFKSGLAVEHVIAKIRNPNLRKDWENFLLGCSNCNSVKSKRPTNQSDFLWPDIDNTFRAFRYAEGGLVKIADGLERKIEKKAKKLMNLVGLDRHPGQPKKKKPAKRDKRFRDREEIWALASLQKMRMAQADSVVIREMVIDLAKAHGCFSVWMSVFENDPDMRRRLVAAFIGTANDSFDGVGQPILRPGGRI